MTKLKLAIAHQVCGRVRMKVPAGKGNPELLDQIKQTFAVIPGIEEVTVNPTTGSVVLHYDEDRHDEFRRHFERHVPPVECPPPTKFDTLIGDVEGEAEFLAEHSHAARAVVDFCRHADRRIKIASGNMVDLKIVFALGLIGISVVEVGVTAATPIWVTLAVFTVNHVIEMHTRSAAPAPALSAAPA